MRILRFFDLLEDHVRQSLSKRPLFYTLIASIGAILYFRGVWEAANYVPWLYNYWWSGWLSAGIGLAILLATGTFVSYFIGDYLIISGIKREKKIAEKTEKEVRAEEVTLQEVMKELKKLRREVAKK